MWFAVSFTLSVTASEDMVIHGGTIYTADKTRPLAEALVALDGKLIHVGSLATAEQVASPDAKWIDASGPILMVNWFTRTLMTNFNYSRFWVSRRQT